MSGALPTGDQPIGFRGLGIEKDARLTNVRITGRQVLPEILSSNPPHGFLPGTGGGIAYDLDTKRPYYSDGFQWFPIGTGVATGTVESYSFIKNGVQSVSRITDTVINPWEASSLDVYHSILGWDLTTGIYTALSNQTLTLGVNIAWAAGISNLGDRSLRVQHMKFGVPTWTTIKEVITQADPDLRVQTTQECQIHAKIEQGDAIRVTVEHDAPIPVSLCGGNCTSISGFRVRTS